MRENLLIQKNDLLIKTRQVTDIDVDGDETDEIQGNIIIEITNQLGSRDLFKIKQINGALHRISENSYGICEECEDDIPEKRLLANPYCMTCVMCAEEKEMIERQRRRV
jgi:DnaK suppressor protein